MEIMFVLIGVSLFLALSFLAFFIWAVKSGQYEDCYTPSVKILFDEPSGRKTRQPSSGELHYNNNNSKNSDQNRETGSAMQERSHKL